MQHAPDAPYVFVSSASAGRDRSMAELARRQRNEGEERTHLGRRWQWRASGNRRVAALALAGFARLASDSSDRERAVTTLGRGKHTLHRVRLQHQ